MAMNSLNLLFSVCICILVAGVCGDTCRSTGGTTLYCTGDCCGPSYARYCCSIDDVVSAISGAAIAAIVVSVVVVVAIIVSIIVCCVCCMKKSQGSPGQIVVHGQQTAMIATSQQVGYAHGQQAYPDQQGYINQQAPQYPPK